jgi:hypothetical protein
MPHPSPHPLALFSLVPLNERAKTVVNDSGNNHLVSILQDGTLALDIGFHIRSKSRNTLATLGRGDTDIFVDGASIAKLQCSFEIDLDTKVVMLYDRSYGQTTQFFGENAWPFEYGRRRQGLVQEGLNDKFGMGGVKSNLVQFELRWHQDPTQTMEKVKNRDGIVYAENPRLARTIDESETVVPSRRQTRIHTPGAQQLEVRYVPVGPPLGSGQFATVYKAIGIDSGKFMAVKILKRPAEAEKESEWKLSLHYALKREVEILSNLYHVCRNLSIFFSI